MKLFLKNLKNIKKIGNKLNNFLFEFKKFKQKKSVSPLIATIVLISFTIAIGSLVINWGKQFITAQTQGLQKASVECQKENVQIVSATLDTTNEQLKFIIRNIGDTPFEFGTLNVYFEDGTVTTLKGFKYGSNSCGEENNNLCKVDISTVQLYSAQTNNDFKNGETWKKIQYIEIPSANCPNNLYYQYNIQQ